MRTLYFNHLTLQEEASGIYVMSVMEEGGFVANLLSFVLRQDRIRKVNIALN